MQTSESTRLFVVDDNRLLRDGLVSMLAAQQDFDVVGSASTNDEALEQIRDLQPDVALIDVGMAGEGGIALTQLLRQRVVRIVILGMIDSTDEIMAFIEAGIIGYLVKESSFGHLVETILSAMRGEATCSPEMAASLFTRIAELAKDRQLEVPENSTTLTARELEILTLVADGLANKDIAQRLFIETQTVKNHIHNILDKLRLHNRIEAATYFRERNL